MALGTAAIIGIVAGAVLTTVSLITSVVLVLKDKEDSVDETSRGLPRPTVYAFNKKDDDMC